MMPTQGFALFATAIGYCGIAWGGRGVVGVQLPERNDTATRDRLARRYPDAAEMVPPAAVRQAIDCIVSLLRGESLDLSCVELDMQDIPPFHQRIYAVARDIQPGETLSYGDIATRLGDRSAAREVGEAMGKNPFPIIVPCHRVLGTGGKVGGFSAAGGVTTKLRLLNIEGARVGEGPSLFGSLPMSVRPGRR